MVETVTLRIKQEFLVSFVKYLQFYYFLNLHLAESYTAGGRIYSIQHGRNVFLKKVCLCEKNGFILGYGIIGFLLSRVERFSLQ